MSEKSIGEGNVGTGTDSAYTIDLDEACILSVTSMTSAIVTLLGMIHVGYGNNESIS